MHQASVDIAEAPDLLHVSQAALTQNRDHVVTLYVAFRIPCSSTKSVKLRFEVASGLSIRESERHFIELRLGVVLRGIADLDFKLKAVAFRQVG